MKLREDIRNRIQNVLLAVLLILVLVILYEVEKFSDAGRLINYAGAARVGVQRYVKLEFFGVHDEGLIDRHNKILDGLLNGSKELRLPKIKDKNFIKNLELQREEWIKLYDIVETMENSEGFKKEKLRTKALEESESYFKLSNNTVNEAEAYAEKLADNLGILEIILAVVVVCLISLMAMGYADKKHLLEQNVKLKKRAYIDVHTGLPNKGCCENIFNNDKFITDDVCVVMFDLNGLKATNDKLGHIAGDNLIKGFANILKKSVREQDFVGRYGGDEFVSVIYNMDESGLEKIFERIKENVKIFNEENPELNLSYAHGFSPSNGRSGCTMKKLLSEADEDMYKNKVEMKNKCCICK